MKGILFFAILLSSFTVQSEVLPGANGWYSLEREGDIVTNLFKERVLSCLPLLAPSVTVRIPNAKDDERPLASVTESVTILLYGYDGSDNGLNALFGYRSTGVLFVPTVAITDLWFCAELRHAYAHMIRSIGAEGEEDPQTERQFFALEEISVREDFRSYLDEKTSGRYALALETAWKHRSTSSITDQIRVLEEVFPQSLSQEEQDIRIEQFRFDLELGKLVRIAEKVQTYISLTQSPINP